jgi:hypothetical protein
MKTKTCIFAILLAAGLTSSRAQDTWTQKADFGGTARFAAAGFSIGSKGYIGTGFDGIILDRDFWAYDPAINSWSQIANFRGTGRSNAAGFSIGSKGYIGDGYNGGYTNEFWEYDSVTNVWTQKASVGTPRQYELGFSIGGKGYIGTGYDGIAPYTRDIWEYDPSTNAWTQKANFGGGGRSAAVGFSIGSKGYIGTGNDDSGYKNDFWEYDPTSNTWTQKANFGGTARNWAVGFSIGSKGYIGTGWDGINAYNDFWEYDPDANTWVRKADFGGTARLRVVGFSIGSKGYIGTGIDGNGTLYKDFWEYTPETAQTNPVPLINQPLVPDAIAPGGADFTLTVNGTGFVSGSVVNWNGSDRATTFVSGLELTVTILASDIVTATTASVTVVNPGPGGGTSNVVFLPVTSPTSLISLSRSDYVTGSAPDSVATADFNRDGKLDLAVANFSDNTVSIFMGTGDGSFQAQVDYATATDPSSVAVGDFNKDGKMDLAVANGTDSSGNTVSVLLGNGDGTFQAHVDYQAGRGSFPVNSVAVGDFNRDGNLDVAVGNYGPDFLTGSVSILLGNGDGTFQPHVDYRAGVNPVGVLVGDFNRDNKLDLAVPNNNAPQGVSILLGNGDGSFQNAALYEVGGGNPRTGMVADFDSDGNVDLAIANYSPNNPSNLSILLGNGDGTFQNHVDYLTGTNPNALAGGDLNGDGKLDLVTVNYTSNNVSVLLGQGDGTFQSHVDYQAGSSPEELAIGDFNTDGRLDIVTANSLDNTVSVLLQTTETTLSLTSAASVKGPFAIDLPLTGASGVEDRSGGPNQKYTVAMKFNQNIVSVGSASSTCGSVQSIVINSADAHKVNLNLVNVAHGCNESTITVTADSITDDQGNVLDSASVGLGLLLGDVNGDRVVNSLDTNETQMHKGQKTVQQILRDDVNADGHITYSDIQIIRQQHGTSLP